MSKDEKKDQFDSLTPETLIHVLREMKFDPTGRVMPLNSYENRVFEIELENREPIVTKVYRPGRWSYETIKDEHNFIDELIDDGVDTVAPIKFDGKETIYEANGLFYTAFDKIKGRLVDEFISGDFEEIGTLLARLHNVGARKKAEFRRTISHEDGYDALDTLEDWIRPEVRHRYIEAAERILEALEELLNPSTFIRVHGDCHRGNLIDDGEKFFFVDFDDFLNGPVAQDFWMLLSGDNSEAELEELLKGYESLRTAPAQLEELFSPLQGLRVMTYSAWIAKRWTDPTFPRLFPQFTEANYWASEVEALEKVAWSL